MSTSYGIHWFRRDLRIAGNSAFHHNWRRNQGRVLGFFCFDKEFLSRSDFSANRFQFFLQTLMELQEELEGLGSDLLFMDIGPFHAFPQLLKQIKIRPNLVTWNRDYEPYARKRDQSIAEMLEQYSVPHHTERDHLLIEPTELVKKNSTTEWYQVYTPFAHKWCDLLEDSEVQIRIKQQVAGLAYLEKRQTAKPAKVANFGWKDLLKIPTNSAQVIAQYHESNRQNVTIPIPKAGSRVGFAQLKNFSNTIAGYKENRDFPETNGTSRLSIFLKNGSLTVPQIISYLNLTRYNKKQTPRDYFLSELIWREFYYHILFHAPHVETKPFQPRYEGIAWQNNESWFQRWKEGTTGFPIVDAGMRELKTTGWMHNRVRMIVASFLTKDLLIDWRWGEKYFMEQLLDGDLASNNGGWQWAASTGCDPQPYFRVFNPWLQSQKFDPKAEYIRKYIPELRSCTATQIHQPLSVNFYPKPIVDHSVQREAALRLYKKVR